MPGSSSSHTRATGRVPAGAARRGARRASPPRDRPRAVDATTDEGYLLLRSFIWPGLDERVERLDAAVATLRELPERPELIRGRLRRAAPGASARSVRPTPSPSCSTRSPRRTSRRGGRRASRAALERPVPTVGRSPGSSVRRWDPSAGPPDGRFELELRVWPGPPRLAAHVDPHGNWLDWRSHDHLAATTRR